MALIKKRKFVRLCQRAYSRAYSASTQSHGNVRQSKIYPNYGKVKRDSLPCPCQGRYQCDPEHRGENHVHSVRKIYFVLIVVYESHQSSLITPARQLDQLREDGCPQPGDRIPALSSRESLGATAIWRSLGDVRQPLIPLLIQPGVQESKRRLARGNQGVIDEGDDARSQRGAGAGAADGALGAVPKVCKVEALGRDVWVATALFVVQTVVLTGKTIDVCLGHLLLVVRRSEIVAETTTRRPVAVMDAIRASKLRTPGDDLRGEFLGGADGSDEWALNRSAHHSASIRAFNSQLTEAGNAGRNCVVFFPSLLMHSAGS